MHCTLSSVLCARPTRMQRRQTRHQLWSKIIALTLIICTSTVYQLKQYRHSLKDSERREHMFTLICRERQLQLQMNRNNSYEKHYRAMPASQLLSVTEKTMIHLDRGLTTVELYCFCLSLGSRRWGCGRGGSRGGELGLVLLALLRRARGTRARRTEVLAHRLVQVEQACGLREIRLVRKLLPVEDQLLHTHTQNELQVRHLSHNYIFQIII